MKASQKKKKKKKKCCYFFCYEDVVEGKNVRKSVKSQDIGLEAFFVKRRNIENIAASAETKRWRSRILF